MTTQDLGNLFPRWHAARLNVGGNTQEVINSWAMNFDEMKMEFARFKRSLFIDTLPIDEPSVFYYGGSVDLKDEAIKRRDANLLANPSFSQMGLARRKTPIGWTTWLAMTTGTVQLVDEPVFVGSYSAKLKADPGERCYLAQTVQNPVEKGSSLTGSLWYLVPATSGLIESKVSRAHIYVSIIYTNGTMDIKKTPLELGTDGNWRRAIVTIKLARELYSATFGIVVENDLGHSLIVYAGAAQLEVGQVPSKWGESNRTRIPYQTEDIIVGSPVDAYVDFGTQPRTEEIAPGHPITYMARRGRSLTYFANTDEVWQQALPTKATTTALAEIVPSTKLDKWGWFGNPEQERFETRWRITNNKLEQYNARIPTETVCMWDIGELYLNEDFRLDVGIYSSGENASFSRTIEALTFIDNRLWVLCKETENGVTTRVVKILNPSSRWPVPLAYEQGLPSLHLECLADIDVGLSTGTADYIGVIDTDPDRLLIRVNGNYYSVNLEYTAYTYLLNRAQLILRSPFGTGKLVTV